MFGFCLSKETYLLNADDFFRYSPQLQKWGFEKVPGDRYLNYICEMPISKQNLVIEERSYEYGYNIDDQKKIPRGPYFIKQPSNVVFDSSRKSITNDVTLTYVSILIFR